MYARVLLHVPGDCIIYMRCAQSAGVSVCCILRNGHSADNQYCELLQGIVNALGPLILTQRVAFFAPCRAIITTSFPGHFDINSFHLL